MIRLATVGTSAITDQFLEAVQSTGRMEHTAVYSRHVDTGRAFAEKHGVSAVYTDLEQMAKSDIDAVYIATPNRFHAAQARVFLQNGKHVICEKPIATSREEYTQTKAIADRHACVYMEAMVSCNALWAPRVRQAVREIGRIHMARLDFCQRSSRLDAFLSGIPQNIFDMSLCAGTLMDLGVYCAYAAVDLLGMPDSITATAQYFDNGADCSGSAVFTYSGFPAVLTYSKAGQSVAGSEIIGENGTLVIDSVSQYAGARLIKDGKETVLSDSPEHFVSMQGEVIRFADFIERKNINEYNELSDLALQVHGCMDKIKQAAGIVYNK